MKRYEISRNIKFQNVYKLIADVRLSLWEYHGGSGSMLLRVKRPLPEGSRVIPPGKVKDIIGEHSKKLILITRSSPHPPNGGNIVQIWLSRVEHPNAVDPRKLHVIEQRVWEALRDENANVVLDGIEYLIIENGLENTLRFVGKLRDMAILTNSNFYVVASKALDERTLSLLRRIVE